MKIELTSAVEPVRYIEFRWQQLIPEGMKYLGDHWERGYGDMSWMGMTPDKPMPWYFFAYDGKQMFACGVKTGAGAFCWWHVDPYGIRLWMDVRSGGEGVKLGGRSLDVATVVERNSHGIGDAVRIGQPLHRHRVRQAAAAEAADLRRE